MKEREIRRRIEELLSYKKLGLKTFDQVEVKISKNLNFRIT